MLKVKVYTAKSFPLKEHSGIVYQVAFLVRHEGRSFMVHGREAIPLATRHPRLPSRREAIQIVWSTLQANLARVAPRLRGVEPDWEPLHDDPLRVRRADNAIEDDRLARNDRHRSLGSD